MNHSIFYLNFCFTRVFGIGRIFFFFDKRFFIWKIHKFMNIGKVKELSKNIEGDIIMRKSSKRCPLKDIFWTCGKANFKWFGSGLSASSLKFVLPNFLSTETLTFLHTYITFVTKACKRFRHIWKKPMRHSFNDY